MPKEKDGSDPYIDISKGGKGEQDTFGHPWNPVTPRVHNPEIFALSPNIADTIHSVLPGRFFSPLVSAHVHSIASLART